MNANAEVNSGDSVKKVSKEHKPPMTESNGQRFIHINQPTIDSDEI